MANALRQSGGDDCFADGVPKRVPKRSRRSFSVSMVISSPWVWRVPHLACRRERIFFIRRSLRRLACRALQLALVELLRLLVLSPRRFVILVLVLRACRRVLKDVWRSLRCGRC